MVVEKIIRTIEEKQLIEKGEHIVVGVSGGPDSVCLLHVLYCLAQEWNLSLYAVHINHCLRGEEADLDQAYTEDLCKQLGIPCYVFSYDVERMATEEAVTTEEMGRLVRYQSFEQVRQEILTKNYKDGKNCVVKIAVAQNQNDQAETILMRIIRGTGIDGLAGIDYIRDGIIIRPLLDVGREEIENYCQKNHLSTRIDQTNLEPMYTRNKIRLELIPYLRDNYNEGIITTLNRLAKIASQDKEFINTQVENAMKIRNKETDSLYPSLDRQAYCKLHPSISKRLITKVFKEMGLIQDISAAHLDLGDRMVREGKVGDRIDFPRGFGLKISYGTVTFLKGQIGENVERGEKREIDFSYKINIDGVTEIPELNSYLKVKILKVDQTDLHFGQSPFTAFFDLSNKLTKTSLIIRTRKPGDYIIPLGMEGTKKLQDFFTDEKIRKEDRDRIPLICLGSEVLWIVGYRINENYKVKKESKEIVCIEYMHAT